MLPLWFSFTSFCIPWRSLTVYAVYGPKVPMNLEEISSQQGSPSPAYPQFFTSLQALVQHQIQSMPSIILLTHSCPMQHISSFPEAGKPGKSPPTCKTQSPEIRVSSFKITDQVSFLQFLFSMLWKRKYFVSRLVCFTHSKAVQQVTA